MFGFQTSDYSACDIEYGKKITQNIKMPTNKTAKINSLWTNTAVKR